MKNLKRALSLVLALIMTLALFAGCGGNGAELSIENATSGMTAPFHAGAAKYFAEKGIEVAVK